MRLLVIQYPTHILYFFTKNILGRASEVDKNGGERHNTMATHRQTPWITNKYRLKFHLRDEYSTGLINYIKIKKKKTKNTIKNKIKRK